MTNHARPKSPATHRRSASVRENNASEAFAETNRPFNTPGGENSSDQSIEELNRNSPDGQAGNQGLLGGEIQSNPTSEHMHNFCEIGLNTAFAFVDSPEQIATESRSSFDSHGMVKYASFEIGTCLL